jgi:diguanylate cyclase (GGDEF)-like protein/PAS domain S-box-containing protein
MKEQFKEIFNLKTSEQRYIFALNLIYKKFKPAHCFIAKFVQQGQQAEMLCHLQNGKLAANVSYQLKDTPCEKSKNVDDVCFFENDVLEKYPNDCHLNNWHITGYLGTTLTSFDQKPVGLLVCLFEQNIQCSADDKKWLLDFKSIIGSELNHQLKCQSYQTLLSQLEMGEQIAKFGTWQWNIKTNQVSCSNEVFNILELEKTNKPLSYSTISSLIHPDDKKAVKQQISALLHKNPSHYNITHRVILKSGKEKTLYLQGNIIKDAQGKIKHLNASVQDITEVAQLHKRLELSNFVFDNASDAIAITDKNNQIISVNKSLEDITGYKKAELLGKNPTIFSSHRHEPEFFKRMWQDLYNNGCWKGEIYNKRKNGEIFPEELSLNTVKNSHGEITNYIAIFRDITARKNTENQLSFFANNETLTGLSNRRYFIEQLSHHLAKAAHQDEHLSLLFIDINQFKEINDLFGHTVGDKALQIIAKRILNCVSNNDMVCCYGGDEFAVLLTNSNAGNAETIALRLQENIEKPYQINDITLDISVSIGIAQYPDSGVDANSLLRNATQAMANVRHENVSGIGFHNDDLQIKYLKKIALKDKLKQALHKNLLKVYYQPIVNAESEQIEKFEALIRWFDPIDGYISPADFIPIAEEFGLIHMVGQFVLHQACQDLKQLHLLGYHNISFSINRSISEFSHKNNEGDAISQAITAAGLPFDAITIEITESIAMSSNLLTSTVLSQLKKQGVKVALDDFCTGYSSLSNLIEYDADFLKIDKSFIDNILTDKNSQILTSTLIDLAQKLGMDVIAEGVENKEQFNLLKHYQCRFIQGFYFSPAQSISACMAMLAEQENIIPTQQALSY